MADDPPILRYTPLLDALGDGAFLVGRDGQVVYANAAAAEIYGVPAALLRGSIGEFVARFRLRARDADTPAAPLAQRALEGHPCGPEDRSILRPDGQARIIRVMAGPLRSAAGEVEAALVTVTDLTSQRELQRIDSEQLFRLFFDSMPQLAWTARPDGHIDYYNQGWYAYTGTNFEQMQGWGWEAVHDPALLPLVIERWTHSLRTGTPFEMEFTLRRADGARRWFLTRAMPLRTPEGELYRWLGINTDIHDQRTAGEEKARLLAAAQAANRAKDEFLAMLGHELRNPLAPIVTAVQLMKLRAPGPSRERDVIERQSRHLVRLVDDLLDVSRVVRGKIDLQLRSLQLSEVMSKAVELASPAIEKAQHHLEIDLAPGLWVRGDEVRLTQVFSNLLTNAAKYTPQGGHLWVQAQRQEGEVLVTVRDDGIGIEPDLLPHVFDLFVQGKRSLDRSEGGLGLGLALVRTLTELHGGQVSAFSDGRGKGSEFTVSLPVIEARSPSPDGPPGARAVARRRRRVLVVDDNGDAGALLAALLREDGHEVATALDAFEAGLVADTFRPEVAVLDLGLPVVDGLELGRRLRARHPEIRLIAVTGYGQDSDRARSEAAGFARHLVKPVPAEELLASVQEGPL